MTSRKRGERALRLVYDDPWLVAVDKPAGMLTVPAPGVDRPALIDRLRRQLQAGGGSCLAVHRLDRDTSGVVVFARSEEVLAALTEQFRRRAVSKTYLALVQGRPRPPQGTVRTFISDQGKTARSTRTPGRGGKEAITDYRVVRGLPHASLVEARPRTGRFNQIRLHMVDLGCPIVGERKYAVASRYRHRFKRPLLHAARLEIEHPHDGRRLTLEAPLADDFQRFLDSLTAPDRSA